MVDLKQNKESRKEFVDKVTRGSGFKMIDFGDATKLKLKRRLLPRMHALLRLIYNLLFICALPFIALRVFWRAKKEPLYAKNWWQRFGFGYEEIFEKSFWLHAVSLGEVVAAAPLIKKLREKYPNLIFVITTMTATGREKLEALYGKDAQVKIMFVPYDFSFAIKSFLAHIGPQVLVVMETELWPNMLYYSAKVGVPIYSVNSRISDHALPGYRRVKYFLKPFLQLITKIAAQSEVDKKKFLSLGVNEEKVSAVGSIKFDLTLPDNLKEEAVKLKERYALHSRPIWIAASTHPGEEELVLEAAKKINEKIKDALLILAPRHPNRCQEVYDLCASKQFSTKLFTKDEACDNEIDVFIVDVIGKMMYMYSISDVAFVGGSLVNIGGHNLLEPAALGKAILAGPHLQNLLETADVLLERGAFEKVTSADELAEQVIKLLENEKARADLGGNALKVVEENRGVVQKLVDLIKM